MLVKCIDNFGVENFLSEEKLYEVVFGTEHEFIVLDNKKKYNVYYKSRFKEVNKDFISNLEQENEELKAKIEELEKSINKQEDKKEEPFIREGQRYFTINKLFGIDKFTYDSDVDVIDRELLNNGNMFPFTDENEKEVYKEVELIAERRRLQSEMEMFARLNNEEEINWDNISQKKWYLYIDHDNNNEITVEYTYHFRELNTTYFTSQEIVKKALEKFKDEIKRLYIDNTIKKVIINVPNK